MLYTVTYGIAGSRHYSTGTIEGHYCTGHVSKSSHGRGDEDSTKFLSSQREELAQNLTPTMTSTTLVSATRPMCVCATVVLKKINS